MIANLAGETASRAKEIADMIERAILIERERAAKVAEGNWHPASNSLSDEYLLRYRIADAIRRPL